jgi:hypothetical protein
MNAPTDKELERLVERARRRPMTPTEEREQMVAWVSGQLYDVFDPPPTIQEVCETLNVELPRRTRSRHV